MERVELLPGIYLLDLGGQRRLATLPAAPDPVYGERIVEGYRIWDPYRSKLGALLLKGRSAGRQPLEGSISPGMRVLYLGAATGTTVSHVSDLASVVYAVEISPRSMRELLRLSEARSNIVPILADAAAPESYSALVEPVDLIYQDVAQRNQAEIAVRNQERYLRRGGALILMIKTRSVDFAASPKEVCRSEMERLKGLEVVEVMDLLPYHHDHWALVALSR
jgi:fibrillarin-like pre-rRNA processing protein